MVRRRTSVSMALKFGEAVAIFGFITSLLYFLLLSRMGKRTSAIVPNNDDAFLNILLGLHFTGNVFLLLLSLAAYFMTNITGDKVFYKAKIKELQRERDTVV